MNREQLKQSIAKDIANKLLKEEKVDSVHLDNDNITLRYNKEKEYVLRYNTFDVKADKLTYSPKGEIVVYAQGVCGIELDLPETERFNIYQAMKSKAEEAEIDILSEALRSIGSKASSIDDLD